MVSASRLSKEIARRRTFAIISHPDAGKTTLTEKLLLYGGAIQLAGAVKARGEQRRAHSDWMKVERERGISVSASVMTFDYGDCTFNLLDTPGHEDFSEDTYRTLTAVDSAVMVLDAAKGIEPQTRKLFEVCRLRNVPIITFINKYDREALEPFSLLDDIEQTLALDVTPASWPIGMGRNFLGCYDLFKNQLLLLERKNREARSDVQETLSGLDDPALTQLLPPAYLEALQSEVEMAKGLCPEFDLAHYREGHMTPVFFGSALNNFGVRELLDGLTAMAPPPRPQAAKSREVQPDDPRLTGFVFKVQANMDPKHRDRIAFYRLCSGQYRRGQKMLHVKSGKSLNVHNAVLFLAQDRALADEAWPGDIIGIPNHGNIGIGDTLTDGEALNFLDLPAFAPEYLQRVRADDPLKAKHLGRALTQLAEEGVARVFKPSFGSDWIVGVVGMLQFDVLADRIRTEYNLSVRFEMTELMTARWLVADDPAELKKFIEQNRPSVATDHEGDAVFLARNAWHLNKGQDDWPTVQFSATKDANAA